MQPSLIGHVPKPWVQQKHEESHTFRVSLKNMWSAFRVDYQHVECYITFRVIQRVECYITFRVI